VYQPESTLASWSLVTHRGVKVDKDGAWDVFAIISLGEKSIIRAALPGFLNRVGIYMTIGQQAMLEQVAISSINGELLPNEAQDSEDLQLPGSVAQLGTSLT